MPKQTIEISTSTILRIIGFILFILFLYLIRDILAIVFLALVIGAAVNPLANWGLKYKIPRVLSVLFIYIAFIGFLVLVVYLIVPNLVYEIRNLSEIVPVYYQKIFSEEALRYYGVLVGLEKVLNAISERITETAGSIFNITAGLFASTFAFVSVVVISFYFSVREEEIEKFLTLVVPKDHSSYALDLWKRTQRKLGHWLQGQLLLAFIVGSSVFIGLSLLGVKYPLTLALIAGLFEIFPIVGPILAAVPAVILALLQSPWIALAVIVLYTVIQQVEGNLIVPLVFRKVMGLNPVIVLISLLIGAKLGGVLGILIAVPAAAALGEFLRDLTKR